MGKLGYIVALECIQYLAAEVEDDDEDKGKGHVILSVIGEGSEQYHHEYHARGAEQGMGKKTGIENAGDEAGNDDHQEHRQGTIGFFEHGTEKEDVRHIADQMVPVGMSRDMGKKAEIVEGHQEIEGQRVRNSEKRAGKAVNHRLVQKNHQGAEKSVGQGCGGIVLNFHRLI